MRLKRRKWKTGTKSIDTGDCECVNHPLSIPERPGAEKTSSYLGSICVDELRKHIGQPAQRSRLDHGRDHGGVSQRHCY